MRIPREFRILVLITNLLILLILENRRNILCISWYLKVTERNNSHVCLKILL